MTYLHCQRRTRVQTLVQIPNPMATLYYVEHVHIAQPRTQIPTPYFYTGYQSESESESESLAMIVVWTRALILSSMATLYYAELVHIAHIWVQMPTPYFCVGRESESESVSSNVNEPQ